VSHVSKVDLVIQDLECLKAAAKSLGLEFREDQKTYRWYGTFVGDSKPPEGISPSEYGKCLHAIGVPNNSKAYEAGVVKNPNGPGYVLLADFWQGGYGLEAQAGKGCSKLSQMYAQEVAKKNLKLKGFFVKSTVLSDGSIKLNATRR